MSPTKCAHILFFITNALCDHLALEPSLPNPAATETLFKILKIYTKFNLNVHVENLTERIANRFLSQHYTQVTIYNYDTLENEKFVRPAALQCLHIAIFTNPLRFARYLTNPDNVFSSDVIMFLTNDLTLRVLRKNYSSLPNLSKSGRVVVINVEVGVTIYTLCFYCGARSGKFVIEQDPVMDPDALLATDFNNLNGQLLKVAYIDYFPYMYCTDREVRGEKITCNDAVGSEFELLKTLSKKMNFTFKLMQDSNSSYISIFDSLFN